MAHAADHGTTHPPQAEHEGLRPRQYLLIGLALTIITLVELWVSYSPMGDTMMIAVLMILSAVKFAVVVAYFMHLRFEATIMTRVFVGSFVLAALILIALIGLFWGDHQGSGQMNREPPGTSLGAPVRPQ